MSEVVARAADQDADRHQREPREHAWARADQPDQPSGEEGRCIHRQQMALDHPGGARIRVMIVDVHADRRRGHDEAHHGVGDHRGGDRHHERRLPRHDAERPRVAACDGSLHRHRPVACQHSRRRQAERGHDQERARVLVTRNKSLAGQRELRPHDRGRKRTEHDGGDRPARLPGRYALGGREALLLLEREVDAEHERGRAQQRRSSSSPPTRRPRARRRLQGQRSR